MNGEKVEDISVGNIDFTGAKIDTVYSKISNTYAVYRTDERVMVQYADAGVLSESGQPLGKEQRLALSALNPLRGEINGLIDGWRAGGGFNRDKQRSNAKRFDRATADALTVALQGDQVHAALLLLTTRDNLVEERTSIGRTEYLITASISAALVVLIGCLIVRGQAPAGVSGAAAAALDYRHSLWLATSLGAIGALFSIALDIRSREIKTDLQRRDNLIDAMLRILIGSTSAVILFSMLTGGLVKLGFGATNLDLTAGYHHAIIVAFLAGFSERLVGNFLKTATLSAGAAAVKDAQAAGDERRRSGEQNPMGGGPAAGGPTDRKAADEKPGEQVSEEDHVDGCLCDSPFEPRAITDDAELPEASGGVKKA